MRVFGLLRFWLVRVEMQKRSYFMLGIELYMEDFSPLDIYGELGLRPSECKIPQKEAITLSYKDWRASLECYENDDSNGIVSQAQHKADEEKKIKGFYKIRSKSFEFHSFRKECDRFVARLEKKKKSLLAIKQKHNAFIVLRIYAFINKKDFIRHDSIWLNLSASTSRFCASVNARILTQIKVL